MKNTTVFIMIAILLFSCKSPKKSELDNNKQIQKDSIITVLRDVEPSEDDNIDTIPPTQFGTSLLSFKFITDSSKERLKEINIYSENKQIQSITVTKNLYLVVANFHLIDWNFDGYPDISILDNCGSGGCSYQIWNYSPKKKKFIYNKDLSEVIGLEMDSINKYIVFHYRGGYSEEMWNTLQYKNNKLLFVKGHYQERWTDTLGNAWEKNTYSKGINNKPKIIKVDSFITN